MARRKEPIELNITDAVRFLVHLKPAKGCIEWPCKPGFNRFSNGYGLVVLAGRHFVAHRLSYLLHRGDIKPHLSACHKCDNRSCVNPAHLFLGTQKDNYDDMRLKGRDRGVCATNRRKTKCIRGHPFSPKNTYYRNGGHTRACRICKLAWQAENRKKTKRKG